MYILIIWIKTILFINMDFIMKLTFNIKILFFLSKILRFVLSDIEKILI